MVDAHVNWTAVSARDEVILMHQEGRPGDLTTGMCEALEISFESFLKFAQLSEREQEIVIEKLAGIFILAYEQKQFGRIGH